MPVRIVTEGNSWEYNHYGISSTPAFVFERKGKEAGRAYGSCSAQRLKQFWYRFKWPFDETEPESTEKRSADDLIAG